MPSLNTVLFDLDGTLIDSIELIRQSLHHTLLTHMGKAPPADSWFTGLGTPLRTQFRKFSDDPAKIEAMFDTYQEHNRLHHDALLKEYPGALAAVQSLKARGLRLGVVTSKMKHVAERGLTRCGFDGMFEVLIAAEDVTKHKPDPMPVLKALGLLKVEPAAAMYVGDSPHDINAGRAAGTRTAACLWGPFSRAQLEPALPDLWLHRPEEMAALA